MENKTDNVVINNCANCSLTDPVTDFESDIVAAMMKVGNVVKVNYSRVGSLARMDIEFRGARPEEGTDGL
jgi:hypothetical protein